MKDVRELFEGKKFSDETYQKIEDFLYRLENTYGEYYITDELIKRIGQNANDIELSKNTLQDYINIMLKDPITNLDELNIIYSNINEMSKNSINAIGLDTFSAIESKIQSEELRRKIMKEMDTPEFSSLITFLKIKEFQRLDEKEKIQDIASDNGIIDRIYSTIEQEDLSLVENFLKEVLSSLYQGKQYFDEKKVFNIALAYKGIAKYLLDNNMDFSSARIDIAGYNTYETSSEISDSEYDDNYADTLVTTISEVIPDGTSKEVASLYYYDDNLTVLRSPTDEERNKIEEQYKEELQLDGKILVTDDNDVIAESIDGEQLLLFPEYDDMLEPVFTVNIKSLNEYNKDRSQSAVRENDGIVPKQIEQIADNIVTTSSLTGTMNEFTNSTEKETKIMGGESIGD